MSENGGMRTARRVYTADVSIVVVATSMDEAGDLIADWLDQEACVQSGWVLTESEEISPDASGSNQ